MPKFSYVVKDKSGKTIKNIVDAYSKNAAVSQLQEQGYLVISIKELQVKGGFGKKGKTKKDTVRKFKRKKIKMDDLLTFARQLATMLEAGVTLIRSLDVICTQIQSKKFLEVITDVRAAVEKGDALSVALLRHPKVFNQFWTSLVEVGEASGTIPIVLNKLTFYMEQQARFSSTIISGIIYPAILLGVSLGAVAFFALFVGPRFEAIFNQISSLPEYHKVFYKILHDALYIAVVTIMKEDVVVFWRRCQLDSIVAILNFTSVFKIQITLYTAILPSSRNNCFF